MSAPAPGLAVAGASAAFVVGGALSRRFPVLVPAVVATSAALVAVVAGTQGSLFDVERGPLGYANATAAYFVVGAAAALLVHLRTDRVLTRRTSAAAVVLFAAVPFAVGSRAGAIAATLVVIGLVPAVHRRDRAHLAKLGWLAVATVVAGTVVAAVRFDPERVAGGALTLTGRAVAGRVELWHEALDLLRSEPLFGVGFGAFGSAGEPAVYAFQRYAHSDYLQVGAELGAGALLLALGAMTWLFRRAGGDDTAVGILLLTALGSHIAVDYVGQFPLVLASAAAVVAASAARVVTRDPEVQR